MAVLENTTTHVIMWDPSKGQGVCALRFLPGCAMKATAMQMERLRNPPPGIVVKKYNPDNREHVRMRIIGQ